MTTPVLQSGYSFTSTRRSPKDPATVIVGETEIQQVRFIGIARIDGVWLNTFKIPNVKRYYFQGNHFNK